ncbi:hypothetical protein A6411_10670 [Prescottella equi]|uniref:hypothetical protein n=1 Tax=Rhodococcus hoagii TaxID=43767 RepID=UPI0009C04D4F|nr:hypothetical protein [Prescottella equi]MBM4634501.1 hypothetical protein [Prescottella equi]OQQ32261.1 hypothetical protein A6411_10670 [Prescottella equi]
MVLAKNEVMRPARWPDANRKRPGFTEPQVLYDDNFDEGFSSWRDHIGGSTAIAPLSRTALRAIEGSSHSLVISTGPRPNATGIVTNHASAGSYRNMSRWADNGLVKLEYWYTLGGCDIDNGPNSFFFGLDTQQWDDTSRGFFRLTCRRFIGPGSAPTRSNTWALTNDSGDQVVIPAQGSTPAPPYPGDNENKMNWNYAALTVDLDAPGADGARGGYVEAQIGPYKYDLTGLGAGRGKQAPQMVSDVGAGPFSGGFNPGIGMTNNTVYPVSGPSWLLLGRARGIWYPRSAA